MRKQIQPFLALGRTKSVEGRVIAKEILAGWDLVSNEILL